MNNQSDRFKLLVPAGQVPRVPIVLRGNEGGAPCSGVAILDTGAAHTFADASNYAGQFAMAKQVAAPLSICGVGSNHTTGPGYEMLLSITAKGNSGRIDLIVLTTVWAQRDLVNGSGANVLIGCDVLSNFRMVFMGKNAGRVENEVTVVPLNGCCQIIRH